MDVYLGLTEHTTVGMQLTIASQVVVTTTAAIDVAINMTAIHLYLGLARTVKTRQCVDDVLTMLCLCDGTTAHGCNLTTAEGAVADMTIVDSYMGLINTTVIDITAAEDITGFIQIAVGDKLTCGLVFIGVVDNLFLVVLCDSFSWGVNNPSHFVLLLVGLEVYITNPAVVHGDIGSTIHSTTLAATVGITLNGWHTIGEATSTDVTDDHVGLTVDVTRRGGADVTGMIAYAAFPAAAIDVTYRTALDIDIG